MTRSVFLPDSVNTVASFAPAGAALLHALSNQTWRSLATMTGPVPADAALSWLSEPGSLTARLRAMPGQFALHCLCEASELNGGVRQVLLCMDGRPWIWGLTHIEAGLALACPELLRLGGQALGDWLFHHPELQRDALEYADLGLSPCWGQTMAALGQPIGTALWARRCRWHLDGAALTVVELFLPAAPLYAGVEE